MGSFSYIANATNSLLHVYHHTEEMTTQDILSEMLWHARLSSKAGDACVDVTGADYDKTTKLRFVAVQPKNSAVIQDNNEIFLTILEPDVSHPRVVKRIVCKNFKVYNDNSIIVDAKYTVKFMHETKPWFDRQGNYHKPT